MTKEEEMLCVSICLYMRQRLRYSLVTKRGFDRREGGGELGSPPPEIQDFTMTSLDLKQV